MTKKETAARDERYESALRSAYLAASKAVSGMVEDRNAFDCGFAWCVSHDPSFNRWCSTRAKKSGDNGHYGRKHWAAGRLFWSPAHAPVQSVGIHEAGARAFRDSLAVELGINVEAGSRLD